MRRFTHDFVIRYLSERKITTSDTYINGRVKMRFVCLKEECGYHWNTCFESIKQGTGCPKCSGREKLSEKFVMKYLFDRDIVSKSIYKRLSAKMEFRCLKKGCGHIWITCFDSIRRGTGCAKCARCLKLTNEYVKEYLLKRKILALDDYTANGTKMKLKCLKKGCECCWNTAFYSIQGGSGCPKCNKSGGLQQGKLLKIIQKLFPNTTIYFNYRGFSWLRKKKRLEIDILIPGIKLAIEYDGIQHYKKIWEPLKIIQARDKIKNKLINEHPEDVRFFIRIPYTIQITKDNVIKILKENGIPGVI